MGRQSLIHKQLLRERSDYCLKSENVSRAFDCCEKLVASVLKSRKKERRDKFKNDLRNVHKNLCATFGFRASDKQEIRGLDKEITELQTNNKFLKKENSELKNKLHETDDLRRQLKLQKEMFRKLEKDYETELRKKNELVLPEPKKDNTKKRAK